MAAATGVLLWAATAGAQSLARKGWAGNGITVAPWWQGAVFYAVRPEDLPAIGPETEPETGPESGPQNGAERIEGRGAWLDGLRERGVDALVLEGVDQAHAEVFDELIGEATRRRLRVVVDLPVRKGETGAELAEGARFWLSRGAAGVRAVAESGGEQAWESRQGANEAAALARAVASFSGQRVLVWDVPGVVPQRVLTSSRAHGRSAHTGMADDVVEVDHWMQGWPLLDAGGLRRVLAAEMGNGSGAAATRLIDAEDAKAALDRPGGDDAATARRVAAVIMMGAEAPLLFAGEEKAGDAAKWYATLGAIRHGNASVRDGRLALLDTGDPNVVAWVRVAPAGGVVSPPVLVVVNFSDRPAVLNLREQLRRAGVTAGGGAALVLAQSGDGEPAGTARVDALKVDTGGVLVGGLEGAPGLEAAPEPVRRRRR